MMRPKVSALIFTITVEMATVSPTDTRPFNNFGATKATGYDTNFRVKVNSLALLQCRNYEIPANELAMVPPDYNLCATVTDYQNTEAEHRRLVSLFVSYYGRLSATGRYNFISNMSNVYRHRSGTHNIHVIFVDGTSKTSVKDEIATGLAKLVGPNYTNIAGLKVLLITQVPLMANNKTSLSSSGLRIEFFSHSELLINPLTHNLGSSHRLLTPEERAAFYANNKLKPSVIPQFTADDAIVRWHDWPVGSVILSVRHNTFTNSICRESIMYHVVSSTLHRKK